YGDGSSGEGYAGEATYQTPGAYIVHAAARDGQAAAEAKIRVSVIPADIAISSLSPLGITLTNNSSDPVDLSAWMLVEGADIFRIPDGTWLDGTAVILLSAQATGLASAGAAVLAYPDGSLAASYPAHAPAPQPLAPPAGYRQVQ